MNKNYKRLKKDIIIMSLIIITPFVFYLYNIVPEDVQVWSTEWFTIDAGYYETAAYFIWILCVKWLTISLLSLWLISCTHSWRIVLVIPIIFEFYKVFSTIETALNNSDGGLNIFLISILFSIPFIYVLFFVASKFKYYEQKTFPKSELNKEIDEQLKRLSKFNVNDYKQIKMELSQLLREKACLPKKQYLAKLIALRNRLTLD